MGRSDRVEPAVLVNALLDGILEHWPDAESQRAGLRENLVLQVEETNLDIMTIGEDLPLFRLMHEEVWGRWSEDPLFPDATPADPVIAAPGTGPVPAGRWRLQRAPA